MSATTALVFSTTLFVATTTSIKRLRGPCFVSAASFATGYYRPPPNNRPRFQLMSSSAKSTFVKEAVAATRTATTAGHSCHEQQAKYIQNALYRIRQVNYMPKAILESLLDFQVDGATLGKVTPTMAQMLVTCYDANNKSNTNNTIKSPFELVKPPKNSTFGKEESEDSKSKPTTKPILTLSPLYKTSQERSQAVAGVMETLRDRGLIRGWRNELFSVAPTFYDTPVFVMERAAVHLLGVLDYGVHINGMKGDRMWMARRSATKSKYPGMLDHIVAGGQPYGLSLHDNCIKECQEEAGIPPAVAMAGLKSVSAISYQMYNEPSDSISRVVLFNYDLTLPDDFVPTVVDGEVHEFFTWNVTQILESLDPSYPDPWKPNCYVVVIDWLIRHGHLSPDVPGYLDVLKELKMGDCQ